MPNLGTRLVLNNSKRKKKKSCHLHDNFMKWDIPETVDVEILRESRTRATRMKVISSG